MVLHKTKLFSLLLLTLGVSFGVAAQSAEALGDTLIDMTLQEAIDIALQENPTVIIAGKEIEVKKQAKKEALWNMLPEASIDGSYSHTIKKQTMAMDIGEEVQTFKVGMKHNYNAGLNIGIPVFAPALYKAMSISKRDVGLAVEKSRASKIDLINEVVKAYFQILLSQDSYNVLNQSLKQAEENLRIVTAKYNHGKVSEYDKIRADVQMRNIRPSVIAASNAIRLAKMQLKVLMGMSTQADLAIKDNLHDYQQLLSTDHFTETQNTQSIDLANNSDLKQLEISKDILRQNVKMQRTNYLPSLLLSYNYSYMSMDNKGDLFHYRWYPTSSVGLTLSIPLFKGSNMTKVRQSKIELAKMHYTQINTERQLRMQASSYLDNMVASTEQLSSNAVSVEQAVKGRNIARKMYEVGRGTILELNDSEVALVQAELAYNQAIYDYLVARSDYAKVLGKESYYEQMNLK